MRRRLADMLGLVTGLVVSLILRWEEHVRDDWNRD